MKNWFIILLGVLVALPARSQAESLSSIMGLQITGRKFQPAEGGKAIIGTGDVTASGQGLFIRADRVIFWPGENQLYAEGNVLWIESGIVSRCARVVYDFNTKRGLTLDTELHHVRPGRILNWHFKLPRTEQRGEGTFVMRDATLTSCEFAKPHYWFKVKRIVFRKDHSIVLRHAFFRYRTIPIPAFYLPYFYRDLKHDWPWYRFGFGSSSEFGTFTINDFGFRVHPALEVLLDIDYLRKRGFGVGLDFEYETPWQIGYLDTYYISDKGEDVDGVPLEETRRYRVKFIHRELLTKSDLQPLLDTDRFWQGGRWAIDIEVNQFSDNGFYQEFFEDEYQSDKEPENQALLRGDWENASVRALAHLKVNEFPDVIPQSLQTSPEGVTGQTEYLPKVSFDLLQQPLWANHLFLTVNSQIARLDRKLTDAYKTTYADQVPGGKVSRGDLYASLSIPWKAGFLHVEPFAFARGTFYDDTLGKGSNKSRSLTGGGVFLTTEFWRTYPFNSARWGIEGLRHVITPEIRYSSIQKPSVRPDDLYFFDEVDTIDQVDRLDIDLRNLVQTRRGGTVINWLEFEVETSFFPNSNRDNNGQDWGNILTDFRWNVHPKLYLFNDNEFDTSPWRAEVVNIGFSIYPATGYTMSVSQRYTRDSFNQTYVAASALISEKWQVGLTQNYEWEKDDILDMRVFVKRNFHDWYLQIGYDQDRSEDGRETTIFFFIGPRSVFMGRGRLPGGRRGSTGIMPIYR